MIELSFHHDLYDGPSLTEAARIYGAYGAVEVTDGADAWTVRVSAHPTPEPGIDERALAAELGNYALGATIEKARAAESQEAAR